jgi:hypothetical protein
VPGVPIMTGGMASRSMFMNTRGRFADRLLEVLMLIVVVIHDLTVT